MKALEALLLLIQLLKALQVVCSLLSSVLKVNLDKRAHCGQAESKMFHSALFFEKFSPDETGLKSM